jgi:8-oxo-dGTP diphosphatase
MNDEKKILVIRRSKTDYVKPFAWETPGGAVDEKEDPLDAAVREVQEETGVHITDVKPFHTMTVFEEDGDKVVMIFYTACTADNNVTLSFEHDQYKWVTIDEFEKTVEGPKHMQKEMEILKNKIRVLIT